MLAEGAAGDELGQAEAVGGDGISRAEGVAAAGKELRQAEGMAACGALSRAGEELPQAVETADDAAGLATGDCGATTGAIGA